MNKTNTIIDNAINNVLCCWLSNHQALNENHLELLQPQLFIEQKHRNIVEAIHALYKKGNGIDINSILYWLKENNKLVDETEQYLFKLPTLGIYLFRYQQDINLLQKAIKAREVKKLLAKLNNNVGNLNVLKETTKELQNTLDEVKEESPEEETIVTAKMAMEKWFADIEKSKQTNKGASLVSKYPQLDEKIKCFKAGSLITIGARPGTGKTTFAMNLIFNNLDATLPQVPEPREDLTFNDLVNALYEGKESETTPGAGIGIVSLETTTKDSFNSLVALKTGLKLDHVREHSDGKENEFSNYIVDVASRFYIYNLLFRDSPNTNIYQICEWIKKCVERHNLKVVIVDHIQLISRGTDKEHNLNDKVSECSRILKTLALELDITIIALSQLNRNIEGRKEENKEPELSDLRDSGSIEQDSDVVMFIIPKEDESENLVRVYIKKNRWGQPGEIDFNFDRERGKFSEMKVRQA